MLSGRNNSYQSSSSPLFSSIDSNRFASSYTANKGISLSATYIGTKNQSLSSISSSSSSLSSSSASFFSTSFSSSSFSPSSSSSSSSSFSTSSMRSANASMTGKTSSSSSTKSGNVTAGSGTGELEGSSEDGEDLVNRQRNRVPPDPHLSTPSPFPPSSSGSNNSKVGDIYILCI